MGKGIVLDDMIDAWLGAPAHRLALRFPRALEQRFEADTGGDRCRSMAVFNFIGFAFGSLLYLAFEIGLPDVAALARQYFLGLAMPIGFAVSAILWLRPPPAAREGLTLAANLVCITVTSVLFGLSHSAKEPLAVAGASVLMVYSALGIQLRFGYAAAALAYIVAAFAYAQHVKAGISVTDQRELLLLTSVTAAYLLLANWRLERGMRRGYLLVLRERLQRQDLSLRNLELDELARRDPLTGLANRRAYDAWLEASWTQGSALSTAPATGAEPDQHRADLSLLGLIVLDVDRFKAFNDFYGHAAGDACLKTIAVCLREQLRGTTDLVARLGGEEFAVLLPGLPPAICADVAERMRLAIQQLELPHSGLGPHGLVSVSAGVASHVIRPGTTPAHLFEAADSALYQAKVSGRNRVCVATLTTPTLVESVSE